MLKTVDILFVDILVLIILLRNVFANKLLWPLHTAAESDLSLILTSVRA